MANVQQVDEFAQMKHKLAYLFSTCVVLMGISCQPRTDIRTELLAADRAFARRAQEAGIQRAFTEYAADSAVLVQEGSSPIRGKRAIEANYLLATAVPSPLRWEPIEAHTSAAGDLGYTLGHYRLTSRSPMGKDTAATGTYVTIWSKQPDGSWKYVVDVGNPGPVPLSFSGILDSLEKQ